MPKGLHGAGTRPGFAPLRHGDAAAVPIMPASPHFVTTPHRPRFDMRAHAPPLRRRATRVRRDYRLLGQGHAVLDANVTAEVHSAFEYSTYATIEPLLAVRDAAASSWVNHEAIFYYETRRGADPHRAHSTSSVT